MTAEQDFDTPSALMLHRLSLKQTRGGGKAGEGVCHVTPDIVILNLSCGDISITNLYFLQRMSVQLACFFPATLLAILVVGGLSVLSKWMLSIKGFNNNNFINGLNLVSVELCYWLLLDRDSS